MIEATDGVENLAALRAACQDVLDHLQRLRRMLDDEIRVYPTPIPRCDAQFNFLSQQRTRLAQDLLRANSAVDAAVAPMALVAFLTHFVDSDAYADGPEEQGLRALVRTELSRLNTHRRSPPLPSA